MTAARDHAIDVLTTHRHGERKEPCPSCAAMYGGIYDRLVDTGAIDRLVAEKIMALADELDADKTFPVNAWDGQHDAAQWLRERVCICPADICLGAEHQDGPGTVECAACLALDPEMACIKEEP